MVKADIIDIVYEKVGFTRKEATDAVESIFDTIKKGLNNGENIHIPGFGSFNVKAKNQRNGRNPRTGDKITISSRKVLTFKPSKKFKETVNITNEHT